MMRRLLFVFLAAWAVTGMAESPVRPCPMTDGLKKSIPLQELPCSIPTEGGNKAMPDINVHNPDQKNLTLVFRNNSAVERQVIVSFFVGCVGAQAYPTPRNVMIKLLGNQAHEFTLNTDCYYNHTKEIYTDKENKALIFSNIQINTDISEVLKQGVIDVEYQKSNQAE